MHSLGVGLLALLALGLGGVAFGSGFLGGGRRGFLGGLGLAVDLEDAIALDHDIDVNLEIAVELDGHRASTDTAERLAEAHGAGIDAEAHLDEFIADVTLRDGAVEQALVVG